MTPVDRRTFLKGVAAASALTTSPALAQDVFPGVAQGAAKAREQEPAWKAAPCRLCEVGCGLLVGIQGGRAVAVKGDPQSPVGDGLACAKGYYSVQALYARDRLKRASIGRGAARKEAPIGEALDLVARRLRETIAKYGKDSVALYGSGQWTIPDAYVASKLFKGALGTNNVESSSRLAHASAMAGLEGSIGLDGPTGCYEDIDHADVVVLWDINLAETDPVLFSRVLARRSKNPAVRIIDVATRTTRTSYAADQSVLHAPRSTQAIANAMCHEIVTRKWVDRAFVDRYVDFKRGQSGLGYGADDAPPAETATSATWDDYVTSLRESAPERVQQLSGVPAATIRWLASLYGDPARKVLSIWGANVNQHARGTYANNVLYNLHLLVGKIATPGNGPFCITGQPGGGNAVHDAGTLTHTLPRGVVQSGTDRRRAADIWGVPLEQIDARPTHSVLSMFRAFERGDIRFLWIQATNPMVSLPNLDRYRRAAQKEGRFIVVSEVYPTPTTDVADVVLPAAMWFEREGVSANAERRLQHFDLMIAPPGDAMSDAWQMIEVARRLGFGKMFPAERRDHVKQLWEEYRRFHADSQSPLPSVAELQAKPGVLWPSVDGHETKWRYSTAHDPKADRSRGAYDFYGHADHRAWIWLRPNDPPAESPSADYPFWLSTGAVLEHWGTGSMTQRIPTLHRAVPHAYVELNREDATRLGIRAHDMVRLVSKRGSLEVEARVDYRSQPQRGQVFMPCFDESLPVGRLMLDASCPISGQPDITLCAVRVERVAAGKT